MKKTQDPRSFFAFVKWVYSSQKRTIFSTFILFVYLLTRLYLYLEAAGVPFENGVLFGGFWRYLDELPLAQILVFEPLMFTALVTTWLSYFGIYKRAVIFKK